jgi:hypothetical protein
MPQYTITVTLDASDIQDAYGFAYALVDKHGEGNPDNVSYISVQEDK